MKEWQHRKLHRLLTVGEALNRNAWCVLAVGSSLVVVGAFTENTLSMLVGFAFVFACIGMLFVTEVILRYVRWRKKTWK